MIRRVKELFADHQIRELCTDALQNPERLNIALQEIYRKGMEGTPQMEKVEQVFARRLHMVRNEYEAQRNAYLSDSSKWEETQMEIAKDPVKMVCCLGTLTAAVFGDQWEQTEMHKLLGQYVRNRESDPQLNRKLLHQFVQTPMSFVFAGIKVPRISTEIAAQVAGVLAMCTYISVKQEPQNIIPELSFDAVCIWSNALTETLCISPSNPDAAAVVGCVMAAQYMGISDWEVLEEGMRDLFQIGYQVMKKILDIIHVELLSYIGEGTNMYILRWELMDDLSQGVLIWVRILQQSPWDNLGTVPQQDTEDDEEEIEDCKEDVGYDLH